MGIKGWLAVGGGLLLTVGVVLGLKKKGDERNEKIQMIIRDVDLKKPEETEQETKTVDELTKDVDQAITSMEMELDTTVTEIAKAVEQELGATTEEILKDVQVGKNLNAGEWIDKALTGEKTGLNADEVFEQQEAWEKNHEQPAKVKVDQLKNVWLTQVEKAVKRKDFQRLEHLFDQKYAGGPWHPSPACVFGNAHSDGVIDDALLSEAAKYFGELWFYSGD